jgi:selenocysteine lyase/cysteine desulfurase
VNPAAFRAMFPALARQAWLDTPASAPGATPVTSALASAVASWQEGSLGAADWEAAAPRARVGFARYLKVPEAHVALMGSVAEAAATVAASLPSRGGTIVVDDGEFRSNLFPWLALDGRGYRIIRVAVGGAGRTEALLRAIDGRTAVGARIFADVTQSLGVLGKDVAASRPDYLAVTATSGYCAHAVPHGW